MSGYYYYNYLYVSLLIKIHRELSYQICMNMNSFAKINLVVYICENNYVKKILASCLS